MNDLFSSDGWYTAPSTINDATVIEENKKIMHAIRRPKIEYWKAVHARPVPLKKKP